MCTTHAPFPPSFPPPPAASSNSRPRAEAVAAHVLGLPRIGKRIAEQRDFVFNPATQIGCSLRDQEPGQLRWWKLTKSQVTQASGLNNARRTTQRWLAPIQKLEEEMAELSMERHGLTKQLVVFFGAATIGAGPRGSDQRRGRVVLVAEHRTTRVSSAVNGQQPCEEELDHEEPTRPADCKPPAGQVEHRLLRPAWSQQRDQPVWGLMWCSVVVPHKPPQHPCSSRAATQPAAPEPGPSTPPPAKRSKRTKAEQAAEPNQPIEGQRQGQGQGC
ncbi:hypothetical protein QJQ45_008706 [Haematococcus lacustris]|nr:hypothetical protein QJQ45_008706 [Haematococcus lacustris]